MLKIDLRTLLRIKELLNFQFFSSNHYARLKSIRAIRYGNTDPKCRKASLLKRIQHLHHKWNGNFRKVKLPRKIKLEMRKYDICTIFYFVYYQGNICYNKVLVTKLMEKGAGQKERTGEKDIESGRSGRERNES